MIDDTASMSIARARIPGLRFRRFDELIFVCVAPVAVGLSTHIVDCGVTWPIVAPGATLLITVPLVAAAELFKAAVAEASRASLAELRLS